MSNPNRGKDFEDEIRKAFSRVVDVSIDRLLDPMAGFAGVKNICDFIVYQKPYEFYIECKTHYGNTLPFSCITENQWSGLLQKSKIPGVVGYVFVWFIDHDKTYAINIKTLQRMKERGDKSVNVKSIAYEPGVIPIEGKKRRVLFYYDVISFLNSEHTLRERK